MTILRSAMLGLALFPVALLAGPYECGSAADKLAIEAAGNGDPKALYWIGSGLDVGECDNEDKSMAAQFIRASAAKDFPPAEHLLGVIARRDGRIVDSVTNFERAVKLGFRLAEADLGFTYMQPGTPIFERRMAYGWLSLAKSRPEINQQQRQYLEVAISELKEELDKSGELKLAIDEALRIDREFAGLEVWIDE